MYDWLPEDSEKILSKVLAKALKDPKFKKRLIADPKSVLKEAGINVPADVKFKIIENNSKDITFVLPENKAMEELSEEEMGKVAGGGWTDECCFFVTHR